MLIRIVKMTFRPECVHDFITVFQERKEMIASFEGCSGVDLLRDISNPNVFFTYSKWGSEIDLNKYRDSDLFGEVWSTVKKWFGDKPEAWSVQRID